MAESKHVTPVASGGDAVEDECNGVWDAKYSFGPVSIRSSESYMEAGLTGSAEATTAAKKERTAAGVFEGEQMSIAFNVNDNMSISYTKTEDNYDAQSDKAKKNVKVTQDTEALQVKY